jgi:uncharacterized membrane protein YeaQ/YmgE (transglycosylase-associated protein family)
MNIGKIIVWIVVGSIAGTLAGRLVTLKKEGLGRWSNIIVGLVGALIGGYLFDFFNIDLGLGEVKVTFEDLIAAVGGSLLLILLVWLFRKVTARKD